jgi:hypothetical protein
MKDQVFAVVLLIFSVLFSPFTAAQQASGGVPVNMVVTAESRHGEHPGPITPEDVMVFDGKTRDQVTSWIPAQGDHAQLDLFILLDDSSGLSLGSQLGDLREFINAQAATTRVGVAYMQNGAAQVAQNLTADHAQVAKSLRLPLGVAGVNASPYFALSDLAKRWPSGGSPRREVIMVSDGIDRYYGQPGYQDPYVDAAIEDAQRAGIVVYTIYNPGAGHAGHSYWENYWGQLYLAQVADETGAESYYIGFTGPAVAFAPFFDDVDHRLSNQYLLTFLAKPEPKSGVRPVKVRTELPDTELVTAKKVFVPAATQ